MISHLHDSHDDPSSEALAGSSGSDRLEPDPPRGGRKKADRIQSAVEHILPSIRVDLIHLFTRDEPMIDRIRMPVRMMATNRPNFSGELTFSTENIMALSEYVGTADLEIWQLLAKSVVQLPLVPSGGVSPMRRPGRGRSRRHN